MLEKARTLLTLHPEQNTSDHVYFEYDAFAEEEVKPDYNYRVGYYMPLANWVEMGMPEELTVTAEPGNAGMSVGMKDEGFRDHNMLEWDIDTNLPLTESIQREANGHATIITKESDA